MQYACQLVELYKGLINMKYIIRETDDFNKLSRLYFKRGLEIEVGQKPLGKVIKHWECIDEQKNLLAGATLLYKDDCCVLEYIAVEEEFQSMGIGKDIISIVISEVRHNQYGFLWLCAKVPEYYEKLGWEYVDNDSAPRISLCQSCEKINVSCFPRIMKKEI